MSRLEIVEIWELTTRPPGGLRNRCVYRVKAEADAIHKMFAPLRPIIALAGNDLPRMTILEFMPQLEKVLT